MQADYVCIMNVINLHSSSCLRIRDGSLHLGMTAAFFAQEFLELIALSSGTDVFVKNLTPTLSRYKKILCAMPKLIVTSIYIHVEWLN